MPDNPQMQRKSVISPRMSKAARAMLGLTQREMADRMGISDGTVRRFEVGAPMSAENVTRMTTVFAESELFPLYRDGSVVGFILDRGPVEGAPFDKNQGDHDDAKPSLGS